MTAHGNGQSDKAKARARKTPPRGAVIQRRRVGARTCPAGSTLAGSTVVKLTDHVAARSNAPDTRSALPAEHSATILFFTGVQILRNPSSDR